MRLPFPLTALLTFVLVGVHLLLITFLPSSIDIMASPASPENVAEDVDVDVDGDVNISDCPALRLPFSPSGQSVPVCYRALHSISFSVLLPGCFSRLFCLNAHNTCSF